MMKLIHKLLISKVILLMVLLSVSSCSSSQKTSNSKKKDKKNGKPEWVMSRPVDRNYYQGVGVAMVNNYTQGHVEEAKKKALNDIISEISVTVKSSSMMQQIEQNSELKSMYQSLTNVSAENSIEGFELVASWGDEKEYWVYYRLSKELYKRNQIRRLDRAKNIGSQFYESGMSAKQNGDIGRAYQDFAKGFASMKEYLDEEVMILTDKGKEYLVDALMSELIELNRNIKIKSGISVLETKIGKPVNQNIPVTATHMGRPIQIALRANFTKGSGEMNEVETTSADGRASFTIQRVTGGENLQTLEISPDIEGMTSEELGKGLMTQLIRIKTDVPSTSISIEVKKILAVLDIEEIKFDEAQKEGSFSSAIKNRMAGNAYAFTSDRKNAEAVVKISIKAKKGEEHLLKNHTLYTTYLDLFITVTQISTGKQVFYKGFSGVKGSRSGGFDQALKQAETVALDRFEKELLPEIGNVDL